MGCAFSADEATKASNKISKKLKKEGNIYNNREHRLLLLGPGESGKSTIFKQVELINDYPDGWPEEERKKYTTVIHGNVIEGIKILLTESEKRAGNVAEELEAAKTTVLEAPMNEKIGPDMAGMIEKLWNDGHIQTTFEHRAEYQLGDSVKYYLDGRLDAIGHPDYIPEEEDIIRSRTRTSGIVEKHVKVNNDVTFKMFDVGGQRRERRKWIHMFEDVKAVLFVAAISEYDQKLREDGETNRLEESMNLFEEICKQTLFEDTTFIVFLNKNDLFEEKMRKKASPLTNLYPDFTNYVQQKATQEGQHSDHFLWDPYTNIEFIIAKFLEKPLDDAKEVYFHVTDATNKENVNVVFDAVQERVLEENLATANIY